ncbi:MAG: phage holin family protein [Clostridia bacterium]|nr:phage holin family protein [Clostridia bacterium]
MILQAIGTVGAIVLCERYLDGIRAASLTYAIIAGLLVAAVYLLLRPLARVLTKPLGCLTFGLFGTVVDAALIMLISRVMGNLFMVDSIVWAAAAAVTVNVIRGILKLLFDD